MDGLMRNEKIHATITMIGARTQTNDHGIRVLQVGHIGGEPGDDRAGGETVNIGEAEALHLLKLVVTQVLGESSAGDRGELSSKSRMSAKLASTPEESDRI